MNISPHLEEFGHDSVLVLLDFTQSSQYSINVTVAPPAPVVFIGRTSVQLTLSYDNLYNVSVVATHLCGPVGTVTFIELYYHGKYCTQLIDLATVKALQAVDNNV